MKLNRLSKLTVTAVVVAAVAVPVGQAATNDKVHVAGTFVVPGQVAEAQLNAGHDPATRLGHTAGGTTTGVASTDTSSGLGTSGIAAAAVLGSFVALLAASALILRHRRRLVTA